MDLVKCSVTRSILWSLCYSWASLCKSQQQIYSPGL